MEYTIRWRSTGFNVTWLWQGPGEFCVFELHTCVHLRLFAFHLRCICNHLRFLSMCLWHHQCMLVHMNAREIYAPDYFQCFFDSWEFSPLFQIDCSVQFSIWDIINNNLPTYDAPSEGPMICLHHNAIRKSMEARTRVKLCERMHQWR